MRIAPIRVHGAGLHDLRRHDGEVGFSAKSETQPFHTPQQPALSMPNGCQARSQTCYVPAERRPVFTLVYASSAESVGSRGHSGSVRAPPGGPFRPKRGRKYADTRKKSALKAAKPAWILVFSHECELPSLSCRSPKGRGTHRSCGRPWCIYLLPMTARLVHAVATIVTYSLHTEIPRLRSG